MQPPSSQTSMLAILVSLGLVLFADSATPWTDTYVRYGDDTGPVGEMPYSIASTDRTFLHIREGNSQGLSPVYFFAHGNGGSAFLNDGERETIINAGYALISWESVTFIGKEPGDVAVCMSDHKRVMQWAVDNADAYRLDTSNFVIGGRSRGSACSWPVAQGQEESYTVAGIYMYNGLPSDSLFPDALANITEDSPPAFFAYGPWCPKPIQQDCACLPLIVNDDNTTREDIHNPRHGQKVVEAYKSVGLGPWINLTDGMHFLPSPGAIFDFFPYFVDTLPNAISCAAGMAATCGDYQAGSPFQCAECVRANMYENGATLIFDDLCDKPTIVDLCLAATGEASATTSQYNTPSAMKALIFDEPPPVAAPVAAPVVAPVAAPVAAPASDDVLAPTPQVSSAPRSRPARTVVVALAGATLAAVVSQ